MEMLLQPRCICQVSRVCTCMYHFYVCMIAEGYIWNGMYKCSNLLGHEGESQVVLLGHEGLIPSGLIRA